MSQTMIERIVEMLDAEAACDPNVSTPPVALLWPDENQEWKAAIDSISAQRPVFTLGDFSESEHTGPAFWLRCHVAGTLESDSADATPIIYLPGVSKSELQNATEDSPDLAPLVHLQHLGVWFAHKNSKDWTIRAVLANKEEGLGLDIAEDNATRDALAAALPTLLSEPVERLSGKHINADYLNALLNPDPDRVLLRWLNDPVATKESMEASAWDAFAGQCKADYGFITEQGVIEATRLLGEGAGKWGSVWQRYREAPAEYPNIKDRLREARPATMFPENELSWPQDNEAGEDKLRAALLDFAALTPEGARNEIASQEEEHSKRRGSVWSQLGDAPLLDALESLAKIPAYTQAALGGETVDELRGSYEQHGWKADLAALRAIGAVSSEADRNAVSAALDLLYVGWLDAQAKQLQTAIGPALNSGNYAATEAPDISDGEVVVFIDGLRLDAAHLLQRRLTDMQAECTIATTNAALPTVTQTAKPALVPIDRSLLGAASGLDASRASSGAKADVNVLRSLMKDASIQILQGVETGDPTGKAWTETGQVDHKGHDLGIGLAAEIDAEVAAIAKRLSDLAHAGWKTITVVTDHGWLLIPSGLPKNDALSAAVTDTKKGRCGRMKAGASTTVPTVPWHWDESVQIAVASGVSCFTANQTYEHGGISAQECFVPRMSVRFPETTGSSTTAQITKIKWRSLALVVEFSDLPSGSVVDVRLVAGDASTSIAQREHLTGGSGKELFMVDDDHEGVTAQIVVADPGGTVILQRETTVGVNQ